MQYLTSQVFLLEGRGFIKNKIAIYFDCSNKKIKMLSYSYLVWLLIFLVTPLLFMWVFYQKLLRHYAHIFVVNGLLVVFGLIWDNWGTAHRLWSFPSGSNVGYRFLYLPIEEYIAFGVLFTFMVTALTIIILSYSKVTK